MAFPSPFEIKVLSNGHLQYFYEGLPIYIVRGDVTSPRFGYAPRQHEVLACPPQVNPASVVLNETGGTARTNMSLYGWDKHFKKLNGDKWEQAAADNLAMFNTSGWPQMESLFFGEACLVRAVPSKDKPATWARLVLPDYTSGPPANLPTFWENPIYVQRFTAICRKGATILHQNDFFYPITCSLPVFMQWSWLERFTPDMATEFITRPHIISLDVA